MNTKKLSKAEIASLVKEEVDGVQGMLKNLLAKKINFYETRADAVKSSTPGVSQASATGDIINFFQSFQEQIKDIQLEILDAPSTETVRRVRGLLSFVKTNLPKLDESDVRKVLDSLLGLVNYTVIENHRTTTKGAKPNAVFNKDLAKASTGNKPENVRRYLQDIIIKAVYELAGQFLRSYNYPKNYEELRDYFDLNKRGTNLADDINEEKRKITADREARNEQEEMDAIARAEAEAEKVIAEEVLASEIIEADKQRIKDLHSRLNEEASILWNILGGDDNAWWSVVGFSAEFYGLTYLQAYEALRSQPERLNQVLLDMKGVAQSKKMVFDEFAEYGEESKKATIAEAVESVDSGFLPPSLRPFLMKIGLDDLRANITAPHEARLAHLLATKNVTELRQYASHKLEGKLADINRRYKKFPSQMNKDAVTKLIIIERLY